MVQRRLFSLVSLGLVAGCAAGDESGAIGSAEQMAISDVASMTQRADGKFDVVCRGANGVANRTEVATLQDITSQTVCKPLPPPPPAPTGVGSVVSMTQRADGSFELKCRVASGAEWTEVRGQAEVVANKVCTPPGSSTVRVVSAGDLGSGRTLINNELFDGFVSFAAYLGIGCSSGGSVKASGVDEYVSAGTSRKFDRLPLPVSLTSICFQLTGVVYEVVSTKNPSSVEAKVTSASTTIQTIGYYAPTVPVSFYASAKFFENFTNRNACSRVTIKDAKNQVVTLSPSSASQWVTMTTPIGVTAESACVSSRLSTPENAGADLRVEYTGLKIADP